MQHVQAHCSCCIHRNSNLALFCLTLQITGYPTDKEDDSPSLRFITMHTPKVQIAFGVDATLLWLPWEEYVQKPQTQESDMLDEIKLEAVGTSKDYILL